MDGYEIRLELLKLSQSILQDKVQSERERLHMDWQNKNDLTGPNGKLPKTINPIPYPDLPVASYKDVIQVAEELNKFVSNKGEQR